MGKGNVMKNIRKLFALALVIFLGLTNVEAASKWDAKRVDLEATSETIEPTFDKENYIVTYTIPESYNGKKIYINVTEDIYEMLQGTYMPGYSKPYQIRIVNNSKYDYNYLNDSLKVNTYKMDYDFDTQYKELNDKIWYNYQESGESTGIFIKDAVGFDGLKIRASHSIIRTSNKALQALYKNSSKYANGYYEGCRVNDRMCNKLLTDEVIGAELIAQGYANGIADLDKFYLDYYNNLEGTSAEKLEDLSTKAIRGKYYGILDSDYNSKIYETNPTVNALGYNWFWNKALLLYPETDLNDEKIQIVSGSEETSKYAIGAYMRGEQSILNDVFDKDLGVIAKSDEAILRKLVLGLDFYHIVNGHSYMDFYYAMGFELAREVINGKLIVNYVDEDGNKLTDSIVTEEEVDTPYSTVQKEFEGFEFLKVEGETTGKYIDGTIEVTYIYKNAIGDVEEPEVPEKPEVDPPHTDADITTSSIIMYIEENKKRK